MDEKKSAAMRILQLRCGTPVWLLLSGGFLLAALAVHSLFLAGQVNDLVAGELRMHSQMEDAIRLERQRASAKPAIVAVVQTPSPVPLPPSPAPAPPVVTMHVPAEPVAPAADKFHIADFVVAAAPLARPGRAVSKPPRATVDDAIAAAAEVRPERHRTKEKKEPGELRCTGVVRMGGRPLVIIGGHSYGAGDVVYGCRILSIDDERVTFNERGRTFTKPAR